MASQADSEASLPCLTWGKPSEIRRHAQNLRKDFEAVNRYVKKYRTPLGPIGANGVQKRSSRKDKKQIPVYLFDSLYNSFAELEKKIECLEESEAELQSVEEGEVEGQVEGSSEHMDLEDSEATLTELTHGNIEEGVNEESEVEIKPDLNDEENEEMNDIAAIQPQARERSELSTTNFSQWSRIVERHGMVPTLIWFDHDQC